MPFFDFGGIMHRREFITLVGGVAAIPLAARAQPTAMPKVGYVWIGEPNSDVSETGLLQGLADREYVIGRDLAFVGRYAQGDITKVPALVAELLALKIDVLVTVGTPISLVAHRATSTIPIVCVSGDPIGAGLAASLNRPGGNVTGLSLLTGDYSAKWLELLREALPKLHRVAALWNPDNPANVKEMEQLRTSARTLDLDLTVFLGTPREIVGSFAEIAAGGFDGLVMADDPSLDTQIPHIITFAAERRLPALYSYSTAVQQGGLMSYSADFFSIWRRSAHYVDRILKGDRPADLPIEQATAVVLKINLKTAKSLGLEMPAALVARADEVIE
jgi:putative ABC transport system substrate-binding protein